MNDLYFKALKAYTEMLTIHINTKTTDNPFHNESESFYETLFDITHKIWEKHVDLWWDLIELSTDEKKKKSLEIIQNLLKEIEDYKNNNKVSLWTEDLLGSIANSLEDISWNAKAFIK